MRLLGLVVVVSLFSSVSWAGNYPYGVALTATTLVFRAQDGSVSAPVEDISPIVGLGYTFSDTISLELDVGTTFVKGEYASTSFVVSYIWALNANFYSASRFLVAVDPEVDVAWLPAVGFTYPLNSGLAPFVELEGVLDFRGLKLWDFNYTGVALASGITYAF